MKYKSISDILLPFLIARTGNPTRYQQHSTSLGFPAFAVHNAGDLQIDLIPFSNSRFGMSTRSSQGCWTCKRRRRACDKTHPTCQNCAGRGIECEGYEVRLRWGSGIASRGQFTGADKPLKESIPSRPKGRQRDLNREKKKLEIALSEAGQLTSPGSSLSSFDESQKDDYDMIPDAAEALAIRLERSKQEEVLFNECELSRPTVGLRKTKDILVLNGGINVLHSTTAQDGMLQPRLPQLCQESSALYTICLAFQLSLSSTQSPQFLEYFDASLREFRCELAQSTILSDGTLTAGLLLCSIGVCHSEFFLFSFFRFSPQGSDNILETADARSTLDRPSRRNAQHSTKPRSSR